MTDDFEKILARFPKCRPELPEAYRAIYSEIYKTNREGQNPSALLAMRLEKWMHRQIVADGVTFPVLEIGAGTLNHVQFEPIASPYDIVEPKSFLYADKTELRRIRNTFEDMSEVPAEQTYARVISVATLEHVTDLPVLLARCTLALRKDGHFSAGIPSEGSLLWYLCWRFGSGFFFRRQFGLSSVPFMRHEHVNNAVEIIVIFRLLFKNVRLRRFPSSWLPASIYTHITASRPNHEVARLLLSRFAAKNRQSEPSSEAD